MSDTIKDLLIVVMDNNLVEVRKVIEDINELEIIVVIMGLAVFKISQEKNDTKTSISSTPQMSDNKWK